jgi:hypothetical protein
VTTEQLVGEGFPADALKSLRDAFVDGGSFYSSAPLVPEASAFAAMRRQEPDEP